MTAAADDPVSDFTTFADRGEDERPSDDEALRVDVGGFEGPLDLLLALARLRKVDLAQISVLELAEQYLAFISEAHRLRLELAADYLVMAAWLAFLKSRLLLPRDASSEPELSGEEMAKRLAFRLLRLDAMRKAAAQLMARPRLGVHVFARGMPEGMRTIRTHAHSAEIYDLLKAYAEQRGRTVKRVHVVRARTVWSIKDARRRLEDMVGLYDGEWLQLGSFLARYLPQPADRETGRTVLASAFGASLELAREGFVEIRQDAAFEPIYVRRTGDKTWERVA